MWIAFTYGLPGINLPLNEFSSLFRYGQQVNSKQLEILLLLPLKRQRVLNHWIQLEYKKWTPS